MFARRRMPPWLALLTPAFVIIAVVVLVPLLFSLYSSFTPYRLTNPSSLWRWIGITNYARIIGDGDFWSALGRTVFFLTVVLNLEMVLGLGIALLMNTVTRGQRVLRTILMFPMMFSPILVGFQFKFIFNDNIGLVNNALQSSGISNAALPWLVDGKLAMFSIMFAEIWMSTSVFAILILAGLFAMPRDPLEAAKVDGCTPFQSFRHITLPFLMPFIYIAMTIRSLDVARAYDVVQIMTGGGPANRTELLWTLMTRTAYVDARMGLANAMGYVSIILSIIFTIYFFRKLSAARGQLGMAA
jgi:multiple sugar transport system permease protein